MPVKMKECTIFIDGKEFHGVDIADLEIAYEGEISPTGKVDKIILLDREAVFTLTVRNNKRVLLTLCGVLHLVYEHCPNRRVIHLAKHHRKNKVQKKNLNRAIRICEKVG